MYRVIKDKHFDFWYIEKKFFRWWIKWSLSKTNVVHDPKHIYNFIKNGHYEFLGGQFANYYYIMDVKQYTEEFFIDAEDFKLKKSHELI